MRFKWESVSQQVDQRRDSRDYALEYLLKRESSINQFGVEVDRLPQWHCRIIHHAVLAMIS